jgi:predicted site-specific integrase-resolvase
MLKPKQALDIIRNRVKMHIPLETMYTWIKKGKLKVKRLGGMILIDPSDLDIFLADFAETNPKVGM